SVADEVLNKVKAFQVGGVDYMTQPFSVEEALTRIENQFKISRLSKLLTEQNERLQQEILLRQQAEQALRESEERWQLALKGINGSIWDRNLKTGEIFHSTRWSQMLGYEDNEIENNPDEWNRRLHPDDFERVMATRQAYLDQKIPNYIVEYRIRAKDGSYKWMLSRGQALWDELGNPIRIVGSHEDINDRKSAELEISRAKAALEQQLQRIL
ncbi:MAG TPA: adenylate/guanylate cyclase with GAF sensor(s), partial [Cyanobacteria bacterium UBA12227]|nr:adenylate/guanylate cyclase with GAF sensor(s) [Cyanobacteria bacterium UBA12227]